MKKAHQRQSILSFTSSEFLARSFILSFTSSEFLARSFIQNFTSSEFLARSFIQSFTSSEFLAMSFILSFTSLEFLAMSIPVKKTDFLSMCNGSRFLTEILDLILFLSSKIPDIPETHSNEENSED
ncbi:hypothetical protein ACOMHN_026192 [Nucella lapillus]